MILRTVCILMIVLQSLSTLYSQSENPSAFGVSAGYFMGLMQYNKLDGSNNDRPHSIITNGLVFTFNLPHKCKHYFSFSTYFHSYHTHMYGGLKRDYYYSSSYPFMHHQEEGNKWDYSSTSTKTGIIPAFHYILGKSTRTIVPQISVGVGLEKIISNKIHNDTYFEYEESDGNDMGYGPNNEIIYYEYYNYTITTPPNTKATDHFGTTIHPNTVVIDLGLGLNTSITKRINLLIHANYRTYANSSSSAIGSYYLAKMYWASVQLQYQFGSKK